MFLFTVENINNISSLVYTNDGMGEKSEKKIEYSKTQGLLSNFNYDKFKLNSFPKNTSMQTLEELNRLKDLPQDDEFAKKYDNIESVFKEVCEEHNLKYPSKLVDELLKSSAGIILDLKFIHNRPRPQQLAKEYGMKIGGLSMESMNTPSFPSGHSTQGFLVGKVLQTKLPITTDAFLEAGRKISYSRNIARAHYPSDSRMGENLGTSMYEYLKHKL